MKAYLLPDDPEPTTLRCVRVYLPDDPMFFAAFWGSMDYLATWLAWERDEENTAKKAADSMKEAVEISRVAWLTGDCCDGSPSGPPYTDPLPDGTTASDATITLWIWWLYVVVIAIFDDLDDDQDQQDVIDKYSEEQSEKLGYPVDEVIDQLVKNADDMTQAERAELRDPDKWEELRHKISCVGAETGPPPIGDEWDAWLDWFVDTLVDGVDHVLETSTSKDLFDPNFLFKVSGSALKLINQQAIEIGYLPDDDLDFGPVADCTWSHTFDFTTGKHGWDMLIDSYGHVGGEYIAGVGFRSLNPHWENGDYKKLIIGRDFPVNTVLKFQSWQFTGTATINNPQYSYSAAYRESGQESQGILALSIGGNNREWTMPIKTYTAQYISFDMNKSSTGYVTLTSIVLNGIGADDPFEGE